jgi:hypothetical protein
MLENVIAEMNAYALNVISKAKSNLQKNNNSGELQNSLDYKVDNSDKTNPILEFKALQYGEFLDKGVQGADPNAMPKGSLARYNKAPSSPYKFGSGNFAGKGSLRGSIDKWVVSKGIPNVRDEKGRFIKRKTMVYLISRSIYNTGLRATNFFTDAQKDYSRDINKKLTKAYLKDISKDLKEGLVSKGGKIK